MRLYCINYAVRLQPAAHIFRSYLQLEPGCSANRSGLVRMPSRRRRTPGMLGKGGGHREYMQDSPCLCPG